MAPGYRNSTRRHNRSGLVDHDIFEGLPVRQWRRGLVTVDPTAASENNIQQNDIWAVELPYGMPKDSHLLPQHSQDLLRAARSGKIYRCSAPIEEEEADTEMITGEKMEKKDEIPRDHGFLAKAWKQVPRHLEEPDVDYLAKKRKGLKTAPERLSMSLEPKYTKNTTQIVDDAEMEHVKGVLVPQGQQADENPISMTSDPNLIPAKFLVPALIKKKVPIRKKLRPVGRGKKNKLIPPTSTPIDSLTDYSINNQANDVSQSGELNLESAITCQGLTSGNNTGSIAMNNDDIGMDEESIGNSDDGGVEDEDDGEENEQDDELTYFPPSASKTTPINFPENTATSNVIQISLSAQVEPATIISSPVKYDSNIFKHTSQEPPEMDTMSLPNNAVFENNLIVAPLDTSDFVITKQIEAEAKEGIKSEIEMSDIEKTGHPIDLDAERGEKNNDTKVQATEIVTESLSNPITETLPNLKSDQYKSLPTEQNIKDSFFQNIQGEEKHDDSLQPQNQKFINQDSLDTMDIPSKTH